MTQQFSPVNLENTLDNLGTSGTGHTPLTLLKELFDNGIDAGANEIITKCSGKRGTDGLPKHIFKYTDNGLGMDQQQLYKSIQITSKNNKDGIGNYGIGGTSAIVNFAQINDLFSPSVTKIISKTRDGQVRSIKVDWKNDIKSCSKYSALENFGNRVTSSFAENNTDDVNEMLKMSSGTIISIYTSKSKYNEISKLCECRHNYQDVEITYKSQLAAGLKLNIEGVDIISLDPCEDLIEGNIKIGFWTKPGCEPIYTSEWGNKFSLTSTTPTGRYSTVARYANRTDLSSDNYKVHTTMCLELCFCKNNYKVKDFTSMKRNSTQFDYKHNSELCDTFNTVLDSISNDDFESLAQHRFKPLHICRKSRNNSKRGLSAIELPYSNAGNWDSQLPNYISKTLIFSAEDDDLLGFTQQNKSCSGWNNAPKYLQKSIQKFVNEWSKYKVHPALDKMDHDASKKSHQEDLIKDICRNKINMLGRCSTIYYPFDENAVIQIQRWVRKYVPKYVNTKTLAANTIQKFMCDCKGSIKLRKFNNWANKYRTAKRFETTYNKYLRSYGAKTFQTTWRNYKIKSSRVKTLNNNTIVIQTYIRRWEALKKIHNMRCAELQFMGVVGKIQIITEDVFDAKKSKRPYHNISEYVNNIQQLLTKFEH